MLINFQIAVVEAIPRILILNEYYSFFFLGFFMSFDMIKKGNTYDKNFVFLKFHG